MEIAIIEYKAKVHVLMLIVISSTLPGKDDDATKMKIMKRRLRMN